MSTAIDPRHKKRQTVLKNLFSVAFDQGHAKEIELIEPIKQDLSQIDQLISDCAPDWPLEQINKVDLSILRLAIHELKQKETPYKVVIDEAVELAKEYGSENSAKFVNGVLGSALKKLKSA